MEPVDTPHAYRPDAGGRQPGRRASSSGSAGPAIRSPASWRCRQPADPNAPKFLVTTRAPHGVVPPFTFVKIRGVRTCRRNSADVNGVWIAHQHVTGRHVDPTTFRLVSPHPAAGLATTSSRPVATLQVPERARQIAAASSPYGCVGPAGHREARGLQAEAAAGVPRQPDRARDLPDASCSSRRRARTGRSSVTPSPRP